MSQTTPSKSVGRKKKRSLQSAEKVSPLDKKQRPDAISNAKKQLLITPEKMATGTVDESLREILVAIQKDVASLPRIEKEVLEVKKTMQDFKESLEYTQSELATACEEIVVLQARCDDFENANAKLELLKHKNQLLEKKITDLESYSRRENLIVHGLRRFNDARSQLQKENCFDTAFQLFDKLGLGPCPLQRCHRLSDAPSSPLIIRFVCYQDKLAVLRKGAMLKGTSIYMRDDIPQEEQAKQAALLPIVYHLKKEDKSTRIVKDKIQFKGKHYSVDQISDLPASVAQVGIKHNENQVLFSGETCPLSNLFHCSLKIDDISYKSGEHYYQSEKCKQLKHPEIAQLVNDTGTAREAMMIGKTVQTPDDWQTRKGADIMKKLIKEKMDQVPEFRDLVMTHRGKKFAEASRNPIWGTGVPIHFHESQDSTKWRGKNIFGELLTKFIQSNVK